MIALVDFVILVIHFLLQAVIWVVIASAILSWLVAFQVVNMRNRVVGQIWYFLDAVTRPLLRPFRRFIPPLGGVDISPIFLFAVVYAFDYVLMTYIRLWLLGLVAGG